MGNRVSSFLDKTYGGSLSKRAKVDKRKNLKEIGSCKVVYLFKTEKSCAPKEEDVRWVESTYDWGKSVQDTKVSLPVSEVRRLCKAGSYFAGSSSFMEELFLEASTNLRLLRKLLKDRKLADRLKKEGGVCHVLDCSKHRYVILLWVGKSEEKVQGIVSGRQREIEVRQAIETIRKNADILTGWKVPLGGGVRDAINQYWD